MAGDVIMIRDEHEIAEQTRLEAFKKVCHKWLHIENDEYIDVVVAADR